MLIDVDAKVDVADTFHRILDEDNIASQGIPPEDEPSRRILDCSRQPQYKSIIAFGLGQTKSARMVFEVVVRVNSIGIGPANHVRTIFLSKSEYFLSGRLGVRIEDADDVGYVFVGETGVLLA
jgi:hypothetical protein